MTDTSRVAGGVQASVDARVTADQETIHGDGTSRDPLRAPPRLGIQIHGSAFVSSNAVGQVWSYLPDGFFTTGASAEGTLSLDLPRGATLTKVEIFLRDNAAGPTIVQADLVKSTQIGGSTTLATQSTDGSGDPQPLVFHLSELVSSGSFYAILLRTSSGEDDW